MSDSDEHWKAHALINAGARLRRLKAANVEPRILRMNQREVLRQAAEFLIALVGEESLPTLMDSEKPTSFVARYLGFLEPLFPGRFEDGHFWPFVIDEIGRMPFGDEPLVIRPEPKSPGQSARPALLAMRRLRAIEWATYYKARGAAPRHYQRAIQLAFGPEWDAIRHWPKSIRNVLGASFVDEALDYAPQGYFYRVRHWHQSKLDGLKSDGTMYRDAAGLGELNEEFIHTEWEELVAILSLHEPSAF